jgi:hypothetical protein
VVQGPWAAAGGGKSPHLLFETLLAQEQAVTLLLDDPTELLESPNLPAYTRDNIYTVPWSSGFFIVYNFAWAQNLYTVFLSYTQFL